jgi:hypothetical protein
MGLSRRVYIALFAVLAELVAVAATGNQAVTKFVANHMATSPLGDLFLRSVPSFPWRISTEHRTAAITVLVSQYAAIATFLVLTFVLIVVMVRGAASFSGPFFVSIGAVVTAGVLAHMVGEVVEYNQDGRRLHTGLGRVGYALFNSNSGLSIMFSLMCGLVVAIVAGFTGRVIRRHAVAQVEAAAAASTTEAASSGASQFEYQPANAAPWDPAGFVDTPTYPPVETGALATNGYGAEPYGADSSRPSSTGTYGTGAYRTDSYGNGAGSYGAGSFPTEASTEAPAEASAIGTSADGMTGATVTGAHDADNSATEPRPVAAETSAGKFAEPVAPIISGPALDSSVAAAPSSWEPVRVPDVPAEELQELPPSGENAR